MGINLIPGEVAMFAGPPGAGKSAIALNMAVKMEVPTLYVSCDMGPKAVARRVVAIKTNNSVNKVAAEWETPEGEEKNNSILQSVDHLYMTYPSRPSAESIARSQMAFMEMHGRPSDLMVIDNLMNLNAGAKDEYTGLRDLSQVFHYLATELQICVLLLHHVNLGGIDLSLPAPLNFIKGQVTELPALVVTFAKKEGELRGSPVKNRHGKSDSSGKTFFTLDYDEEKQILSDQEIREKTPTIWDHKPIVATIPDWTSRAFKDS